MKEPILTKVVLKNFDFGKNLSAIMDGEYYERDGQRVWSSMDVKTGKFVDYVAFRKAHDWDSRPEEHFIVEQDLPVETLVF